MRSSKVKVGIIGLGDWGVCHLQALQSLPDAEVAAVCDLNEAKMLELADRYGIAGVYGNSADLCADPELDLIIVATYEKGHLEPTLQALRAGCAALRFSVRQRATGDRGWSDRQAGQLIYEAVAAKIDVCDL
ncbi:MAG: dehydrogenase [Paenibacillaceae bacterium]|nr:dehydrogenase [Paenibacillaceae bacterium]